MNEHERLLTVTQAAERLAVSQQTIRNKCHNGALKYLRFGAKICVIESSVDNYIKQHVIDETIKDATA